MLNRSVTGSLRLKEQPEFNFLMQSMERQKENVNFNMTMSSTTVDFMQRTSKRQPRKSATAFDNEMHVSRFDIEGFIRKIEKYMAINEQLLKNQTQTSSLKQQLMKISDDIQSNIENFRKQSSGSPFFNNVSLRKSLNMRGFESMSKRQEGSMAKRIKQLQGQNQRLSDLVSRHENTNIRMFIKINEQESSEIEHYKALLASSYEGYKQLQAKVKEYQNRVRILEKERVEIQKQIEGKSQVVEYLEKRLLKQSKETLKGDTTHLERTIAQQQKQIETAYSNMKKIVEKHEQKEMKWLEEMEKLKKKSRSDQATKKSHQCTQTHKQELKADRPQDLVMCLAMQATTIQQLLCR